MMRDWRALINEPQCCDCLDLLAQLPDGCVDLAILDPPFNLGFDYGDKTDDNRNLDEYRQWLKQRVLEVERVVKSGRLLFLWQAMRHCLLVWQDYPQARIFAACKNFVQIYKADVQWSFDPVLFWHKGKQSYQFASKGPEGIRRDWHIGNAAKARQDKTTRWHPCPRPIDTVEYIMAQWSNPGDLVLDPFAGSFTTAVVAERLGRQWISCDIEPQYVELGRERLRRERLQPALELEAG